MSIEIFLLAVASCVVTFFAVGWLRSVALKSGVLDIPNERSSHSSPMPTSGGLGIALVVLAGLLILWWTENISWQLLTAMTGGSLIAAIGLADDKKPMRAGVRLAVHLVTASWATFWVGGLPPLQLGSGVYDLGSVGDGLAVIAIVWVINLFNFMDGIDGLAGSEAAFVAGSGAFLAVLLGTGWDLAFVGAMTAGSCIGFLGWNWPPARIFMGDVGSGFLGFMLAVLALAASHRHPTVIFSWLIFGGLFLTDATVTLLRRVLRGEKAHKPHRSHAYQRWARHLRSHRVVTCGAICVNVTWCLPLALIAAFKPQYAQTAAVAAFLPLIIGVILGGAGLPESRDPARKD